MKSYYRPEEGKVYNLNMLSLSCGAKIELIEDLGIRYSIHRPGPIGSAVFHFRGVRFKQSFEYQRERDSISIVERGSEAEVILKAAIKAVESRIAELVGSF